jgi:hypothetical protein
LGPPPLQPPGANPCRKIGGNLRGAFSDVMLLNINSFLG